MSDPIDTLRRMIAEADLKSSNASWSGDKPLAAFHYARSSGLHEAIKVLEKNDD